MRLHKTDREDLHCDSDLTRRDLLRLFAGAAGASVLAGCAGRKLSSSRPQLLVWSCGGNYDLLRDFNRRFEELKGCSIGYTGAPIEHLVALIASRSRGVGALVGRSGPGWRDLANAGRLAGKRQVFALDLYVIVVPLGNPAGIQGLPDLKRPDVKTVYSPTASGPSSDVIEYLLKTADKVLEPGIWDGYVRNAVEAYDCGWKVFPPIIEGRAHATVTRQSMTTVPEIQGKVELIPIPVEVPAVQKRGFSATPQSVAPIAESANPELAAEYVKEIVGELGYEVARKHGYVHRLDPDADHYEALFRKGEKPPEEKGAPPAE